MTKNFKVFGVFGVLLAILAVSAADVAWARVGDQRWKKVEEAKKKGLPKTAVAELEQIVALAIRNKAYGEALKAIELKITLEGYVQGNKAEEKITRMEAELARAPEEMKPVMQAFLANWYWQYFQQNRYRFVQRTRTAAPPGEDFTTWDLPRILSEVDKQFTKALASEQKLKSTPVTEYRDLLPKGALQNQPTMYDFVAYNALAFYTSGEQGAAGDEFELAADGPIFGTVEDFIQWQPAASEIDSPTFKAVRLYQNLLAFHRNDKNKTSFIVPDLARLRFGFNKAFGEEKNTRYKEALQRVSDEWANLEISATALYEWASILNSEGSLSEAFKVATRAVKAFPKSSGGSRCAVLVRNIQAKSVSISTERVWNAPLPSINVSYRNINKIYFRVVAIDFVENVTSQGCWYMTNMGMEERQKLLATPPALAWAADLPPTADFKQRMEKLPAPNNLKPGFYILLASRSPSFARGDNWVSIAPFWVSDLALVIRTRTFEGVAEGFVLNAITGEPAVGATVRAFAHNNSEGRFEPYGSTKSDDNGLFRFSFPGKHLAFLVEHGEQRIATGQSYSSYTQREPSPSSQTVFFTDRSLYRPGQTIQYKGICILVDKAGNQYKTLAEQTLNIALIGPDFKEIARQQVRTNDYGAFSGSFSAPRDRLTGKMKIQVREGPGGSTSFNVEEYKRPKFQVELGAPKEASRLNSEVCMPGRAGAYTGAPVGGATVKYRVVREVRFPVWSWWGRRIFPPAGDQSRTIAQGTSVTEPDGSFTAKFIAKPDPSALEKNEPTFKFTVFADVIDTTGETRSAQRSVRVGYTALQASLSAGEWQTSDQPVDIDVSTKTLDGEGQAAEATLKVYALSQPAKVERPAAGSGATQLRADLNSLELGEVVCEQPVQTDASGGAKVAVALKPGIYRAMLDTKDRFGKTVRAFLPIQVVDLKAKQFNVKVPNHFSAPKWSVEPGESLIALWGTGYDRGRAFVEIEHQGRVLRSFWTAAGSTQEVIEQGVDEQMRGGFMVRVTYVRENRAYLNEHIVDVPWTNKKLDVRWEHFTSKLAPAQKDTWTAVVLGPDAKQAVAEMVAGLYDASLDAFLPHRWMESFNVFKREFSRVRAKFENQVQPLRQISGTVDSAFFGGRGGARGGGAKGGGARGGGGKGAGAARKAMPSAGAPAPASQQDKRKEQTTAIESGGEQGGGEEAPSTGDLGRVSARKNLQETAFFFPHLLSDANGVVKMEFTIPEALTEWKFMGFAHDRELRSGFLTGRVVTAKDLTVEPNPPRFVREGDTIEFTVKVTNRTDIRQTGEVELTFSDARSLKSVDADLVNNVTKHSFDIPRNESRSFAWPLTVPDGMDFLTYKAVGATSRLSDGEEGYLPVLSRRIMVTESLPLPVRGRQTKEFEFTKLIESGKSPTLQHQNLTVQMVSQPAWYAVMALPYLIEFPHECTEQTFNRLYANALARHLATSDPKIRRIFDLWKDTPALDSPLEKNQDLKAVMLEETPWVRQAQAESQARKNIGILFDENRLNDEIRRGLQKLAEQQLSDGAWPWFPGGRPNDYISLYITTGFGRMRHLGIDIDVGSAVKSLGRLDNWINRVYREIFKHPRPDENHLNSTIALYLYGRSFFLKDKPIDGASREAVDYFLGQARKYWLQLGNRQSQAHLAVALKRFGRQETAVDIMKSIKERSVSSEELGMFWRDLEHSWWWSRAPIETQAMMVEAFDEVMNDAQAVEECKVWLLKQKQTQGWKTTKATADAVYALMKQGADLLGSDALVEVSLAGRTIQPDTVEAGTGFYEKRLTRSEIKPEMGNISVKKIDEGVSWGSVHWQYLEDVSKVTPYEGTPLKLKKTLFIKDNTAKGQVLKPVNGPLAVGDELVVRIELRVDRDMEYIHLKDQRGSGTEPVNVLSGYKFREGLAYYESTRDTASHFFIDYLPKGVYVFEYSTRVQLKGRYQTGIAGIQCMYAPEFNSHSESFDLEVK